ncbi:MULTISPECIES: bifunctional nuclease family protein [Pseudothermotoga]|jgi:hypothetical protein|uniref:BFN domain-containing protein n=1 Tax=Pseudothermotoga lettingae (strain ATCC BAA-301 / DSM 14385 / NBRC 107922 / TMO) TaxID=416591 RepID=A8F410_PSELT|nr:MULTISPECIES: bifunctional nuclease family protein [Pseudothermotoga]ABV32894.1 protein of unknown function DUF151 [Pseudothermotoga lettingae TMO]KUK21817.1 MAG: Uncharacterized protein XD56_0291 [Pseudothermotoga lettingae]MDI3494040.1 uncharacterized protein [Pseudothermotoga sp.]MDK2884944.1 uncharacterized protein [Pseudothermotoga sp.]GLI48107.1 hypothetical protein PLETTINGATMO_02760 [Pseudothermotoga lettingae TMO]
MRRAWIKALVLDKAHNSPVVILGIEGTNKVVPIWIGACEANALAINLEGLEFPRPLTHDLIVNILDALDARLEKAIIHSVKDNVYHATLVIRDLTFVETEDEEGSDEHALIEIDARPSDSIVLAVKKGVPIYVSNEIVEEHAIDLQIPEDSSDEEFKKFVESLDIDKFREMLKDEPDEEGEEDE